MKKVGEILIMAALGAGTIWGVLILIRLMSEWAATISCF
jgi:hypothetical protein